MQGGLTGQQTEHGGGPRLYRQKHCIGKSRLAGQAPNLSVSAEISGESLSALFLTGVLSTVFQESHRDSMDIRSVAGRLFQWKKLVMWLCVGKKTSMYAEPCSLPTSTHHSVPLP